MRRLSFVVIMFGFALHTSAAAEAALFDVIPMAVAEVVPATVVQVVPATAVEVIQSDLQRRREIRSMDITERPNRLIHVYGNTVRYRHKRGQSMLYGN